MVAVRPQAVIGGRLTVVDRCSVHANAEKRGAEEKEVESGSIGGDSWGLTRTGLGQSML
jgi:hypothetical protein